MKTALRWRLKQAAQLFRLVRKLAGVFSFLAVTSASYGQGTVGFSGQTQPSLITESQYIVKAAFDSAHNYTLPQQANVTNYTAAKAKLKIKPGYVEAVPSTGISIDDEATLLKEYDTSSKVVESKKSLGSWRIGIVSDGDFNESIKNSTAPTAKTGSLGVDAVWMKSVYRRYTYTANSERHLPDLVGEQTIRRPVLAVNGLIVLFSGTSSLTTSVAAKADKTVHASLAQQRLFGQALLVPGGFTYGNGVTFIANGVYYLAPLHPDTWYGHIGIAANVTVVQTNWSTRDTSTAVNILAPSIGLVHRGIEGHFQVGKQDNYIQVQPFLRYTMRHLFGDIEYHQQLLDDALNSRHRDFHAVDVGFTFTINAVRVTANVPVFLGARRIEGFTHGQPVVGFGLAAAIRFTD